MLAVVPFLIDNSPISVSEAASTFGITENDMRNIVRTLFVTGIPGDSGKGLHGDLFDFDFDTFEDDDIIEMTNHVGPAETPRFSGREAAALIAGLQYMSDVVRDEGKGEVTAREVFELLQAVVERAWPPSANCGVQCWQCWCSRLGPT
jgi:proteasome accessory factor C